VITAVRAWRERGAQVGCAARHIAHGLFDALSELGAVRMAPPRDEREAAHRLAGVLCAVGKAHGLQVTVRGELPRSPALVVANHVSYLDPLAILPVCPALPIAKGEIVGWPIVGSIADALGVTFVRRADGMARVRALRHVDKLLSRGVSVLNFAEGTTTDGLYARPFWRGTFGVAQRLGVPVVPVALRYKDPDIAWFDQATFMPHYLRTATRPAIEVELEFGAPLRPRTGEAPEDFAARTRNIINRTLTRWNHAGLRDRVSPSRSNTVVPSARVSRAS